MQRFSLLLSIVLAAIALSFGAPAQAACPAGWTGLGSCQTAGTAATANTGTSGATVPLLNGNNTHSGNNTLSGGVKLSGLSTGTQVSCTGLDSSNNVVLSTGACGGSGVPQIYITGLLVTKHAAANSLDISAGEFYDPGSSSLVTCTAQSAMSAGTLGVSQWNQVYATNSSGCAFEVVNNASPPSTTYAGNMARKGGTGGNKRWIGAFLTDGSSNIYDAQVTELASNKGGVTWYTDTTAAPFRVLSAGTQTTYTSVDLSGVVPKYAGNRAFMTLYVDQTSGTPADASVDISIDGTHASYGVDGYIPASGTFPKITAVFPIAYGATPQVWYKAAASSGPVVSYIDVPGYEFSR